MDSILQHLTSGELTVVTVAIWIAIAFLLSVMGGACAGVVLAGKDLGNELAALMGGMFGPTAAVPAVLAGLIVLQLF